MSWTHRSFEKTEYCHISTEKGKGKILHNIDNPQYVYYFHSMYLKTHTPLTHKHTVWV